MGFRASLFVHWGRERATKEGAKTSAKPVIRHIDGLHSSFSSVFIHSFIYPELSGLSLLLCSFYPGRISNKSGVDKCSEANKAGTRELESEWALGVLVIGQLQKNCLY